MAVNVQINQKGLLKKNLPIEIILGDDLACGYYDEVMILVLNEIEDDNFVIYNPDHIGRGISVDYNKNYINLNLPSPAPVNEIKDLFEVVKRIVNYWNSEIVFDDKAMSLEEFLNNYDEVISFNKDVLKEMCEKVLSNEDEELTLYSAFWPLIISKKEALLFNKKPLEFDSWLHNKQNIDVYYAKALLNKNGKKVTATYVLTESIRSIFPKKPDKKELKCDKIQLVICINEGTEIYYVGDYNQIMSKIDKSKITEYDSKHIIIEGLNREEIDKILS